MASDASEDGDRTHEQPGPGGSAAFAATVAPESPSESPTDPRAPRSGPTPPPVLPAGTTSGTSTRPRDWVALESDATVDAPTTGEAAMLPVVSAAHYRAEREI